jgi:hypothetical protein
MEILASTTIEQYSSWRRHLSSQFRNLNKEKGKDDHIKEDGIKL